MPGASFPIGLREAMGDTALLGGVADDIVQGLVESGDMRHYKKDTYLFHQGDEANNVLFLWSGRVEISSITPDGREQIHELLSPYRFFGELGVVGEMPRTATARALEDCELWACGRDDFAAFLRSHADVCLQLLKALARQLQDHELQIDDLLSLDLKGRVAKRLLLLGTAQGDELPTNGSMLADPITHADLASMCGGTRENVSRVMADFQRRGYVAKKERSIVLVDVAALRRLARL